MTTIEWLTTTKMYNLKVLELGNLKGVLRGQIDVVGQVMPLLEALEKN